MIIGKLVLRFLALKDVDVDDIRKVTDIGDFLTKRMKKIAEEKNTKTIQIAIKNANLVYEF